MSSNSVAAVEVRNLSKHYGTVVALNKVSISIAAGEYFVLLGPSGGGKTTLLRTIGGFHKPTGGDVLLHGENVGHLPPDKRPTSMVFQSYALFPHMTVMGNVGYGLSLSKRSKEEIKEKSEHMLEMVGLSGYGDRKPHELSGGQQQRVQLARSLVLDRDILLLDEPLAALDAKLRKDMCYELKHLQEKVGITFIHVTHNQEEAMTVADRIALIAEGNLIECADARAMYEAPDNRFTASFIGDNNLLDGTVSDITGDNVKIAIGDQQITVNRRGLDVERGQSATVSIRSELTEMSERATTNANGVNELLGSFREATYLGLTTSNVAALETGEELVSRVVSTDSMHIPDVDTPVILSWQADAARLHTRGA
ncbi:MAG: ABC transporter ATP-binding protein [Granulosicoccus sp.]